jgi:hypothetical protein
MTESEKLEQAAREYISSWVNPLGKENIEFTQGFEYAAFKAGVSWEKKENLEDTLHKFTGAIQTAIATGKMPRVITSNDWAQFVIDYVKELS